MTMRGRFHLLVIVAEAALLFTVAYFVIILIVVKPIVGLRVPLAVRAIATGLGVILPSVTAAWWMFRKLLANYSRSEALGAAIAFGVFAPVPLAIGLVLGQIVGGYVGVFLGNRFAFAGAVAGIVLMISLTNFITSTFAVWIVRRFST